MIPRAPTALLFLLLHLAPGQCDESQSIVNGKKSLHQVDDKFISVSVDPAILFSGIKLSATSLQLATNLSPIYLRIAGPSTAFLEYTEDESRTTEVITESTRAIAFGPTKWWALNEWMRAANFTPVFAINDADRVNDDWDPKATLSLLEISSKMNLNCYWQLGYDSREKSQQAYKNDLTTLRHILDAFPGNKATWKTVGSDLSEFQTFPDRQIEDLHVDALMWEPEVLGKDRMYHYLSARYAKTPEIWTSAPKSGPIVSFDSALDWGVQIGEAAKNGYSVIFRQPRLQELFSDTPAYWISILHKHLMGRNVLEVKQTSLTHSKAHVYAHCSRNQNGYSIRGAMTVMMVNNQTQDHTSSLLVAGTQLKNLEVRSYILTSPSEDSLETLLNGESITLHNLTEPGYDFKPKLRRAKATTHLSLTIPGKSIGFFVLPGARIPVCIEEEDETSLILEEMDRAQRIDFLEEDRSLDTIFSRINTGKPTAKLSDLYHRIEEEIEEDEKYYKRAKLKPFIKTEDWKQSLLEKVKQTKAKGEESKLMLNKFDLKKVDLKNLLKKEDSPKKDLDLSSGEILKILGDRAKAKVGFASSDFEELLEKVKSKIRVRRSARGGRGGGARKKRPKRDINMALLKIKSADAKRDVKMKSKFNFDKKEASVRQPGQDSVEYLPDDDRGEKKPTQIYAGFASAEDDEDIPDMKKVLPGLPMKPSKELGFKDLFSLDNRKDLFSLDAGVKKDLFTDNKKDLFTLDSGVKKDLFSFDPKTDLFSKTQFSLDNPKSRSSDLFALEAQGFPKISFPPIFQAKTAATTVPTPKKKNFVDYVKDDQSEEKLEDLEDLEDALNSYHGFHETFGDDVTVVKRKDSSGKDDLLASEFLINNHDNEENVEQTIKKLEDYFNDDASYESNFGRYKRDVSQYTEEDVDFYTKLMRGNIQHMRNSIRERKRQDAMKRLSSGDFFKSLLPTNTLLRSKLNSIDKDIVKPSGKIQDHQARFLKTRLAHRRKMEELQSKFPKLDLKSRLRKTRALADEIYKPKVNMSNQMVKNYESKLSKIRAWKDEDILLLPRSRLTIPMYRGVEETEREIPMVRNRIRINRRMPRGSGYDSLENTIDGFVNYIKKESDLDGNSGEYSLILPSRDAVSLKLKNGGTDIKIHMENKAKDVDSFTCLASDFTTTTETPPEVVTINDDEETTVIEDNDMEIIQIVNRHYNDSNPERGTESKDGVKVEVKFFNKIFDKVKDFVGEMHKSLKHFFV